MGYSGVCKEIIWEKKNRVRAILKGDRKNYRYWEGADYVRHLA